MNYIGELITSKANSLVKSLATLKDKKGRDELSLFIAEGVKLTREALEAGLPVKYILINKNRYDVIIEALGKSVDIIIK
jgi:TrmH family RNA methyltransferase